MSVLFHLGGHGHGWVARCTDVVPEEGGWLVESEMRKRRDEISPIRIRPQESGSPMPVAVLVLSLLLYKSPPRCPITSPVPHPRPHTCPLPPPPFHIATNVAHFPIRSSDARISHNISRSKAPLFSSSPTKSGRRLPHPRPIIPILLNLILASLRICGYRWKSPGSRLPPLSRCTRSSPARLGERRK